MTQDAPQKDQGGVEGRPAPQQLSLQPTFDDNFLPQYVGRVMTDPEIAIMELVANSWDAGATAVRISWPEEAGGELSVADDGTGMSVAEFEQRWPTLSYNRVASQGTRVDFPPGSARRTRTALGRNGVGRHAMFCFAPEYTVDTVKDGERAVFDVRRKAGQLPFEITLRQKETATGHGTTLRATVNRSRLSSEVIGQAIGTRFVADPEFRIGVNGKLVELTDLGGDAVAQSLDVDGVGTVTVRRFASERPGRTSRPHGVAWWVNHRLVGAPSWEGYEHALLDGRTGIAKRMTYVVVADPLAEAVKQDWTGFHSDERVEAVRKVVTEHIESDLHALTYDARRDRKRAVLAENVDGLKALPPISQQQVAKFVSEVQTTCPRMTDVDLSNAVRVFTRLEQARTGYGLLERLSTLSPTDLDGLHQILDEWSVSDVKKVLGELRYRLQLIRQLERLVENVAADELHDLQPLFERGLWIFGPEFESLEFSSNRSLATVVKKYFGTAVLENPRHRPDFVVLPDSSIGVYGANAYDERHEVSGFSAVVIVELKKGGFEVTHKEKDQALGYARDLVSSGKVLKSTRITCYVLGAQLDSACHDPTTEGSIRVQPRAYSAVLAQAHARTFHLLKHIESIQFVEPEDEELAEVLRQPKDLFGN